MVENAQYPMELDCEQLRAKMAEKDTIILDTRLNDRYNRGHIKGSASARCETMQQKQIIMSKIPKNYKIILIDDDEIETAKNISLMKRFGFEAYSLKGGIKNWDGEMIQSGYNSAISNVELWDLIKTDTDIFLLDVREQEEFAEFKIPNTVNVPLSKLFTQKIDIPKGKKVITICSHGNRSMVATFALAQQGIESASLDGGMSNWNQVLNDVTISIDDDFDIIQVEKIGKGCLSHVIISDNKALVIDPTHPARKYLDLAKKGNYEIIKVIDTHQHADHVSAARLLAQMAKATLYLSALEQYDISSEVLNDGDTLKLGKKQLDVIHTPGHTYGSMTITIDKKYIFSGDTLFVDGIGRPDLRDNAQQFAQKLYETISDKILKFPNDAKIFPTHHDIRTKPKADGGFYLDVKTAKNLPLLNLDKKEFIQKIIDITTPRPMNYSTIIKVNKGEIDITAEQIPDLEMGPNRCSIETN